MIVSNKKYNHNYKMNKKYSSKLELLMRTMFGEHGSKAILLV